MYHVYLIVFPGSPKRTRKVRGLLSSPEAKKEL